MNNLLNNFKFLILSFFLAINPTSFFAQTAKMMIETKYGTDAIPLEDIQYIQISNQNNKMIDIFLKNENISKKFDVFAIDSITFNDNLDSIFITYLTSVNGIALKDIDSIKLQDKYIQTLYSQDINNNEDFILDLPGKLRLTIPKENIDEKDHLTITELMPGLVNTDFQHSVAQFEFKLDSKNLFPSFVKIEIPLDKEKYPQFKDSNYRISYYNEEQNLWRVFRTCYLSENYLVVESNHFTKISLTNTILNPFLLGYTDYLESEHFNIYYHNKSVFNDKYYGEPFPPYSGDAPHLVQDYLKFLEESYSGFKHIGCKVNYFKVNVFVTSSMEASDGGNYNSKADWINLNSYTQSNAVQDEIIREPNKIPRAVAHEFSHLVEDYYLSMIFDRWWTEVLAVNAERVVWENTKGLQICEPEYDKYGVFMRHSWDNCNKDPDWYIAGGFIGYILQEIGSEKWKNLLEASSRLFIPVSKNIDQWLFLNTKKDLGDWYHDFIKNFVNGNISCPSFIYTTFYTDQSIIESKKFEKVETYKINENMPHLSARLYQFANRTVLDNGGSNRILIKVNEMPAYYRAYLYSVYAYEVNQNRKIIRELVKLLQTNDSLILNFENWTDNNPTSKRWYDILVINKSIDQDLPINIEISPFLNPDSVWYSTDITVPIDKNVDINSGFAFKLHLEGFFTKRQTQVLGTTTETDDLSFNSITSFIKLKINQNANFCIRKMIWSAPLLSETGYIELQNKSDRYYYKLIFESFTNGNTKEYIDDYSFVPPESGIMTVPFDNIYFGIADGSKITMKIQYYDQNYKLLRTEDFNPSIHIDLTN